MKQKVCGSGWAAATSLVRVSSRSSRRAIVRVSGASLPQQTSRPAALQVGTHPFHFFRRRGNGRCGLVGVDQEHAGKPLFRVHQQDSEHDGAARGLHRPGFKPLKTPRYIANQCCPPAEIAAWRSRASLSRSRFRRSWRAKRSVSDADSRVPGGRPRLAQSNSSNGSPLASKRHRRRSRSRSAKRCAARSTWGTHLSSSRCNRLMTALIVPTRSQ